jgi:hypothetical protein
MTNFDTLISHLLTNCTTSVYVNVFSIAPYNLLQVISKKMWLRKEEQDSQCRYKRNMEARSRNQCCRGEAGSITHSDSVSVALVI